MSPRLVIRSVRRDVELAHWFDAGSGQLLASRHRDFWLADAQGRELWRGRFPAVPADLAGPLRLARRLGRLDQCILAPSRDAWFACRRGVVYSFDPSSRALRERGRLRQCRNLLQVLPTPDGRVLFGEYGTNPERRSIPIWSFEPSGEVRCLYEIPARRARHVHGVFHDPFDGRYLVATGDFAGESWLIRADERFKSVEYLGDGTQPWRAVCVFFTPEAIIWLTDTQLEQNHVMIWRRGTTRPERGQALPSPVWFGRQVRGGYLAGCAWEPGPGCMSDGATLLFSRDAITWTEIAAWKKDPLPVPLFKAGVLRFAGGPQRVDDFVVSGEALRGFDGRTLRCAVEDA